MCGKKAGAATTSAKSKSAPKAKSVTPKKPTSTPKPKVEAPKKAAAPVVQGNGDYTVVTGDTLSEIAQQLNVPGGWQSLAEKNTSIVNDPDLIFPGQKLVTK